MFGSRLKVSDGPGLGGDGAVARHPIDRRHPAIARGHGTGTLLSTRSSTWSVVVSSASAS